MEEFKFRKAEKIDIEQLVDMRIEYLKEDLGEVAIYDEVQLRKNLQLFFEEHLNNDIDAFVALCGNQQVSRHIISDCLILTSRKVKLVYRLMVILNLCIEKKV